MGAKSGQIQRKASELGYRHIWTGAFAPPNGVTFWPDDDFEAFLAWGRVAVETEILYIDEFQIQDQESGESRDAIMCYFVAQGICHTWASESSLRTLRNDWERLVEDLDESFDDYETVDHEEIESQVLEYVNQELATQEFVNTLADPKFYQERGAAGAVVFRIAGELNALRTSENVDYRNYHGLIANKIREAMKAHRDETERKLLLQLDDVRDEITKSDREWTTRLVKMREKTAREYLLKTFGFASSAIAGEIARMK